MATDFGIDFLLVQDPVTGLMDIDPNWTTTDDPATVIGQAIWCRLTTPQGALFYDKDYGIDVRQMLRDSLDSTSKTAWQTRIAQQCELDDRVSAATVAISLSGSSAADVTATVTISLQTGLGPFILVLKVSDVTVKLLSTTAGS